MTDAVGVFDSGVGGVSVLRDLARRLPRERFVYYGDDKNAPYGTRPEEEIRALALAAGARLFGAGAKALVVACNTATSAAIEELRERYPHAPVVGMEPALKPASQIAGEMGRVLVLATPATLRQSKFGRLYAKYGARAEIVPCPGLMDFVERGELEGPALDEYLIALLAPYAAERLSAAVLGCTHYTFLKRALARALPGVPLLDGNDGTARRLAFLLAERGLLSEGPGGVEFTTSGDDDVYLPLMKRLFAVPID